MDENRTLFELAVDDVRGNLSQDDKRVSDQAIRDHVFELLGVKNIEDKRFSNRLLSRLPAVFEYIVEVIDEVYGDPFAQNSFFSRYVDYSYVPFGTAKAFSVNRNEYYTVSTYSGYSWDTRRQRILKARDVVVDTTWYNVHVYGEFNDFVQGRIDFADLVRKISASIDKHVQNIIHANFMNAPNTLPSDFNVSGSAVITDEMVDLAERVRTATGSTPIIAGTKQALLKLSGAITDHWVSNRMADEQNYEGIMSSWQGYELVPIPNVFEPGTYQFVDMDKLFVLPGNIGRFIKVVNEGGNVVRAVDGPQGNQDWTLDYNMSFKMGSMVVFGSAYGVYNFA